ncbi:hypothetical protein MRX96_007712 [Rhipicephalus microplus]
MGEEPQLAEKMVKATCALHNFLIQRGTADEDAYFRGYAATQRRNQPPSCFVIDIGHHHRLLPVRRAALAWKVIGKGHRPGCLTSQTKKS